MDPLIPSLANLGTVLEMKVLYLKRNASLNWPTEDV
jgi:hypothetical protein